MMPTIRSASPADAEALATIYNPYLEETIVTFEEEPVAVADMASRIEESRSSELPWLVAECGGRVVGYAHAGKWKGRCAYRYAVEISAYIARSHHGMGIGFLLYTELFRILREQGIHTVIGGIALPNPASVALHEKFGLRKVAHFHEVGFKFGQWVDVGYWQCTL